MTEQIEVNLFAPEGGWTVRIVDLSDEAEDNMVEEIKGFATLMVANEFARRYVRDSIERCRTPRADAATVIATWRSFGEDAFALDGGEAVWRAEEFLHEFASSRATSEERDWRVLDPRGDLAGREDDDEDQPFDDIDEGENDEEFS
jgi:hypothetical protein